MANSPSIVAGQHYREVQPRFLKRPGIEWIVEAAYTGTDGVAYVRLVNATDRTMRKTLSVSVLNDRHRFQRVEG